MNPEIIRRGLNPADGEPLVELARKATLLELAALRACWQHRFDDRRQHLAIGIIEREVIERTLPEVTRVLLIAGQPPGTDHDEQIVEVVDGASEHRGLRGTMADVRQVVGKIVIDPTAVIDEAGVIRKRNGIPQQ